MLCIKPIAIKGQVFGCGQCLPCRISRRRIWMHRILLEASLRKDNAFVTLTYDDENLPENLSVDPKHLQLFLKRLRKNIAPMKVRYYGVGEYGDKSERPHYHLALFGFPGCSQGRTNHRRVQKLGSCCVACDTLRTAWSFGAVDVGAVEPSSAAYICGYVTKKLTKADDPRLGGRHPEFARMSLRPGIGADMMDEVASGLLEHDYLAKNDDVPSALQHGRSVLPLGKYLRKRLRVRCGLAEATPQSTIERSQEKLRPMLEAATANAPRGFKTTYFKNLVVEAHEGKRINALAKLKRNNKGSI